MDMDRVVGECEGKAAAKDEVMCLGEGEVAAEDVGEKR